MKIIKHIYIVMAVMVLFYACAKKNEILESSDFNEFGYNNNLVGNNTYNQRIRDYYQRYGTYLLYNFTPKDAYWTVTKWDSTFRVIPADSNYVDRQLNLLDSTFFRYYQDSTLRKYLPVKFLLCSSIRQGAAVTQLDSYFSGSAAFGAIYNYETFLANWGSSRILNIKGTKDSAAIFRGNINYSFLRLMVLKNKTEYSDVFTTATDYITAIAANTQAQRYKRGFLTITASTTPPSLQTDWSNYLQAIVQNPYSYLTDATGMNANNTTMQGILTPVKDSSGLIRRKYDEITNFYLTNYNIDLKRIGEGAR